MPRCIASCPDKFLKENNHQDADRRRYYIQVITPIFGGGSELRENDPATLIRPSSIRGHLRFFWRSIRGTRFDKVSELLQREGEIWGTTETPSKVALRVEIKSLGKTYPCAYFPEGKSFPRFERNHPPYALFPFQGNKRDGIPPANCTSNVSFELEIIHPKSLYMEVNAAIWGWTNFGGIGARTRRGCGALYCKELSPDRKLLNSWYRSSLKSFDVDVSSLREWPTLPGRFLARDDSNNGNVLQGWTDVIGLMQAFRQGQGVGRNPGSERNRPGRSRWPEPESIRQATSSRSARHSRMPSIPNDAFPRAELGLPIVFHFKDQGFGDPKDTELYPVFHGEEKTRMSSPIILRPMMCRNGEVLQLILRLNAPSPNEVILKKAPGDPHFKKICDTKLANYPNSPLGSPKAGMPVRSSSGSAADGFLAFAKENGFQEVT